MLNSNVVMVWEPDEVTLWEQSECEGRVLCYQNWDKSVKMIGHVLLKICITWRSKVHGNGSLHFYPHQSSTSLLRMTSVCVASLNYSFPCPRQIFSQTVGKHFFCFESVTCCKPLASYPDLLTPVLSVCRLQYLC